MLITKEYIDKINPMLQNKYSNNLYFYLMVNMGKDIKAYKPPHKPWGYYIGTDNEVVSLKDIIYGWDLKKCNSIRNDFTIDESWWGLYLKYGLCILIEHNVVLPDSKERMQYISEDEKICKWCGKKFKLYEKQIPVQWETRTEWEEI